VYQAKRRRRLSSITRAPWRNVIGVLGQRSQAAAISQIAAAERALERAAQGGR
jgi:hypothetical protein